METIKLRNDSSIWFAVTAILAGCGMASSVMAQSMSESATAPTGNVLQEQLTGGSTSSSPGASAHDYLNNPPPGETFSLSSAATLNSVSIQGNGDSGYWDGSSYSAYSLAQTASSLQWYMQIGSVSGTTITPLASEEVTGFGPNSSSDFITFNLAGAGVSLNAGTTYEFSMYLVNSAQGPSGSTWYGASESLVPVVGGNAFNNGSTVGSFGNTVVPITTGSEGGYDFVYVLQGVPEPTTLALLGGGAGLLSLLVRRRRA
jgi:PEP-CTERM motif-containing protein